MKDTRVVIRKNDSSLVAKGYNANGQSNPPWNLPASVAGAGAIRSSARDMLIYARANLGDASGALNKAIQLTHDTTFSNSQNTLGLAWIYIDAADGKIIFHNGATGGYRTYLAIDLQKKCAVVLLANSAIDPDKEGNALIAWLSRH
jgi:CubicO group peptidase (beta-lactamase class C family)